MLTKTILIFFCSFLLLRIFLRKGKTMEKQSKKSHRMTQYAYQTVDTLAQKNPFHKKSDIYFQILKAALTEIVKYEEHLSFPFRFKVNGETKNECKKAYSKSNLTTPVTMTWTPFFEESVSRISKKCGIKKGAIISGIFDSGAHAIVENNYIIEAPLIFKLTNFDPELFEKISFPQPVKDPDYIDVQADYNGGDFKPPHEKTKEPEFVKSTKIEEEMELIWDERDDVPFGEILSDIEDFYQFKQKYGDHWSECKKILSGRLNEIQSHILTGVVSWHNAHLIWFEIKCLNRSAEIASLKYNVHPVFIDELINGKPDIRFWNRWSDKDYVFENLLGANIEALIAFFHWHYELGISQIMHCLEIQECQALDALKRIETLGNDNKRIARKIKKIEESILDYFRDTKNN
jgi:hypothetical protein